MTRLGWLAILALVGCAGGKNAGAGDDDPGVDAGIDGATNPDGDTNVCAATEACDGVFDDDCDGEVDEGCGRCPLMSIACTTGCCPIDRWEVDTVSTVAESIDVDPVGNIYFAYTVPSSGVWLSKLAIYDAVPGTWRNVTLGGGTYRTRVKLDAMGRVHVAYGNTGGGGLFYKRSDDHGMTFSEPVTIGTLDIGGVFDLALDSTGAPHIAYSGDKPTSYSSDLRYAHLGAGGWMSEIVDPESGASDYPDIEIGFADRPHIVYEAYNPPGVTATTKRYLFHNGNRWIDENIDIGAPQVVFTGDHYFSAHSLRLVADGSRELLYTRRDGTTEKLLLATRGALDADSWQLAEISGATEFETPVMFVDAAGMRGAVSDGLRLHREAVGGAWTSTPTGVPGTQVAVARRGGFLYVGFAADNKHPTVTVVELP